MLSQPDELDFNAGRWDRRVVSTRLIIELVYTLIRILSRVPALLGLSARTVLNQRTPP